MDGPRLADLLTAAAKSDAGRTAIVHGENGLSYGELFGYAEALAERFAAGERLRHGARIALIAPNTPALAGGLFACWRLGAVAVPLSARLREHELRQVLADAEPVLVVSVRSHLGYSFADLLRRLLPDLPTVERCLIVDEDGEADEELAGSGTAPSTELDDEFAALLYTSGTTGIPKAALVRHGPALAAASHLADIAHLGPGDTTGFVVPVSHAFGFTCLLANVAAGAAAALVESGFSSRPFLDALDRTRVTVLHGSPSVFTGLLKARPEGVPTLRTGYVAGAASPPGLLEAFDARGTRLLNMYGLTETGAVTTCRLDDPPEVRYRTAGDPLPGLEVQLGDENEDGLGEVHVRGDAVTPGYFRRSDETAAAFVDGWFRTGDLGTFEYGRLRIAGRLKELVHVGGFNVFQVEVESALLEHPDVVAAAVVGVPHPRMGEVLRAFVVPRDGANPKPSDLLRFARGRIAGYKLPYVIELRAELPLLASGKPDRQALAHTAAAVEVEA